MTNLCRHMVFLFLLLFFSWPVYAQRERDSWTTGPTVEVSGHVRTADEGQPARNISVRLERVNGGHVEQSTTDHQGRFRFSGLQRGYYTVIINAPGFVPAQQETDLQVILKTYLIFDLVQENLKSVPGAAATSKVIDANVPLAAQREFERGRIALTEKKTAVAISHMEKAVTIYPDFYDAQLLLGTTYIGVEEWERAERALNRASQIQSNDAVPLVPLGEVLRHKKAYAKAEKVLLDALKIDDRSWQAHFTLGRVYWEMGDVAKAAHETGRTLQLKSDVAEAHLLAGNILLRVNAPERALVEYEEYLRLEPQGAFAEPTRALVLKLKKVLAQQKGNG